MHNSHRLAVAAVILASTGSIAAQEPAQPTIAEQETFLKTAKVIKTRGAKKGITNTVHATLSDGKLTHDASIQTIDESKARFETALGPELNFKDSYKFNIAGYRLGLLLSLDMIPPSVERSFEGKRASFTWWVDDVIMDEGERLRKKTQPPDSEQWNNQMMIVRVFDQLIYNVDRNLQNLLVDKNWKIWMIDHSRAFRLYPTIREPKNLTKCERNLLARLKTLDQPTLKKEFAGYVNDAEIKGLLGRRDVLVKTFEGRGPEGLYDISAAKR